MEIVKFKIDHIAGFAKGDVRKFESALAKSLKKEGYVSKATEKELKDHLEEVAKRKNVGNYEENKAMANSSHDECEGCNDDEKGKADGITIIDETIAKNA